MEKIFQQNLKTALCWMKPIANQRNDENLIKLKLIKIPNNWKNHYTEYKCRWQDNSRITQTRRWRILTKCKENRKRKLILDFWKLKIKRNEYISLFSRRDIEKSTSHPRQKSILLNRKKQIKKQNYNIRNIGTFCKKMVKKLQHTEHRNILQKNGQKTCKAAFMQKISTIFQKLNA